MTYLGWGVWTPDTELAHHGIPGMKWGDRNGPPYPLRPGARSSAEKKAGTPIADKFADVSRKLKKKAAVSKAKRTRRKKAKFEHDRQEALRKGSAEDVLKYRGHLTNEELEKAVKRIEWENKLEALDRKSKEVGLTKADRLFGNNGALGKIKEYSGNVAAIAQNYNKIKVAMEYAMQGKTAPADKKPKETKNSDKKTSDTKAQETRSVDASSGKTSDDKPEESTQTEERRYADISSKVREYSEDRQAKDYARNKYGGIDIEKYDERRRQLRHSMTYLEHTGIKGQKWGSRRFRGYDGKLTPAGKERYYSWDRKQITNQIPDGTFAYNEVDDEVYESVGGRMVAIDHNRPDYEERKAEARRAYETQKEIEEHFKHAYLGWGIYGIVDDRTYLAHHGVKGMHWGIRRYQPYPDGKRGKFIGRNKLHNPRKLKKARLQVERRFEDELRKPGGWYDTSAEIDKRVSKLVNSNKKLKDIQKNWNGDGSEFVWEIQARTGDKKLKELDNKAYEQYALANNKRQEELRNINAQYNSETANDPTFRKLHAKTEAAQEALNKLANSYAGRTLYADEWKEYQQKAKPLHEKVDNAFAEERKRLSSLDPDYKRLSDEFDEANQYAKEVYAKTDNWEERNAADKYAEYAGYDLENYYSQNIKPYKR